MSRKVAGKASRKQKSGAKRANKVVLDPVMQQALANGAQLSRGEYEVVSVPNPYGEVMKDGNPVPQRSVKRKPQYELLRSRGVITKQQAGILEWYAERLALAGSGMVKNALAGNGGGSAGVGIPISEARMDALRDIDWVRGIIEVCDGEGDDGIRARSMLEVFDAVMAEEVSFKEIAKRPSARRYVLGRTRDRSSLVSKMFAEAVQKVKKAYDKRFPQGPGRILAKSY